MKDDERDEILARLDQWREDFNKRDDKEKQVIENRLNSHAADLKNLKEWRAYLSGAWAVIAGAFGLHLKGHS